MNWRTKLAAVVAAAAMGAGAGAGGATAAISLDPGSGPFTGASVGQVVITAGSMLFVCEGTVHGDAASATTTTIPFTPAFGDCALTTGGIDLGVDATIRSPWELTYASGTAATSVTTMLGLTAPPAGPSMVLDVTDFGCEVRFAPQSGLSDVVLTNVTPTGVTMAFDITGMEWTSDCPTVPASGTDGTISATFSVPGITLTDV